MKKIVLIFLSLTMFTMASTSREEYLEKKDYYKSSIQNAPSEYEMEEVASEYNNFLNKDIDATYKYLLLKLNDRKELKNAFIGTQEEWKKLRDKEYQMIELSFKDSRGSISGFAILVNENQILIDRLDYLTSLIPEEGDITSVF